MGTPSVQSETGIVAGGYGVGPQPQGMVEKGAELDFPVAPYIRIGGAPGGIRDSGL